MPAQSASGVEINLPTFEVTSKGDQGYRSTNTASITRLDAPVRELPISVQIMNPEFMNDVGATTLFDVGRYFVGGNNQGASTNLTAFNLRGFADVVPDDQQRDGFRFSGRPNLYNVDRIEIIRGPNSVVQGASDAGGQVNIITKSANYGQQSTALSFRTDSQNGYRGTLDNNVSGQLGGHNVALRVNSVYEDGRSFIKFTRDNYRGVALAGKGDLDKNTTVTARFEYLKEDRNPWNSIPDRWSGGPGLTGGFSQGLNRYVPKLYNYDEGNALAGPDSIDRRKSYYWLGEVTHRFSDNLNLKLQAETSSEDQDLQWPNNGNPSLSYDAATDRIYVLENWQWARSEDRRYNLRALLNYALHLSWSDQNFVAGYAYLHDELRGVRDLLWDAATNTQTSYRVYLRPGEITAATVGLSTINRFWKAQAPNGDDVGSPSAFLNSTGSYFGGKLKTVLGYSWNSTKRTDFIYTAPASGSFRDGSAVKPAPSSTTRFSKQAGIPMVSAVYALTPTVNIYANYSESFKPQTAYLPTLNLITGAIGSSLDPETGQGYEGGFKFDLIENKLSGSIGVYSIKKQNIAAVIDTNLVQQLLGPNVNQRYYTPGVEQSSKGVEVELFYNPTPALTVSANYAYNSSDISKNSAQPSQVGLEANVHFKHIANLAAKYTFTGGLLKGWFIGGNTLIRGRQFRYQGAERGSNPGYMIFGLLAGYSGKWEKTAYTVQMNVDNIFDKTYLRTYAQIGEPLQGSISATIKF